MMVELLLELSLLSLFSVSSSGTSTLSFTTFPHTLFLYHPRLQHFLTPHPSRLSHSSSHSFSFCGAVADVIPDSALNLPRYTAVSAPRSTPPQSPQTPVSRHDSHKHNPCRRISLPPIHISSLLPARISVHRLLELIPNPISPLREKGKGEREGKSVASEI